MEQGKEEKLKGKNNGKLQKRDTKRTEGKEREGREKGK